MHNNNDFNKTGGAQEDIGSKDINNDVLSHKASSVIPENPFWFELKMTGKCPERRAYHTSFAHNNR